MMGDYHVRFCERFRGEIPLYLLDFILLVILPFNLLHLLSLPCAGKTYFFAIFGRCVGLCELQICMAMGWHFYSLFSISCFSSSLLGKTVWYLLAKICWLSFGKVILTNVSFFCLQSTIPIVRFSSFVFLNSS